MMDGEQVKTLIPKSYIRIALTDFEPRPLKAEAFYSPATRKFMFRVNESIMIGPIDQGQLDVLGHVILDVISMKGRYNPV